MTPPLPGWHRLAVTLGASTTVALLLSVSLNVHWYEMPARAICAGLVLLAVFHLLERWPRKLPNRLPRWVLQAAGMIVAATPAAYIAYWVTTGGEPRFAADFELWTGYRLLKWAGILLAPPVAFGSLLIRRSDAGNDRAPLQPQEPSSQATYMPVNPPLRWIRASIGSSVKFISVDDIDYLKSDEKYTRVTWHGADGQPHEAVVRTSLRDLLAQLDPLQFVRSHRSVVVNIRAIAHVTKSSPETAEIHLTGRRDVLPVSRKFLHLFRQM